MNNDIHNSFNRFVLPIESFFESECYQKLSSHREEKEKGTQVETIEHLDQISEESQAHAGAFIPLKYRQINIEGKDDCIPTKLFLANKKLGQLETIRLSEQFGAQASLIAAHPCYVVQQIGANWSMTKFNFNKTLTEQTFHIQQQKSGCTINNVDLLPAFQRVLSKGPAILMLHGMNPCIYPITRSDLTSVQEV